MVKLSDYVIQFFVDRGITDAFLASGGGIMHLLDAVGRNRGLTYYCNYLGYQERRHQLRNAVHRMGRGWHHWSPHRRGAVRQVQELPEWKSLKRQHLQQ